MRQYKKHLPAILVFALLLISAVFAEWQYDEAWTYQKIEGLSVYDIVSYKFNIANNHVLNSLYFYLLQYIGAIHPFFYRLISLAAFWVYWIFLNKLMPAKQDSTQFRFADVLLLLLMPYMPYFAQGRGYAVAIASFTASLYYYKSYAANKSLRDVYYFMLSGSIASLAIFSFSIPFMAMLGLFVLRQYKSIIAEKRIILAFALAVPVLAYVYTMGKVINTADAHIIGTNWLFKNGMFSGMISYMCLADWLPLFVFKVVKLLYLGTLMLAIGMMVYRRKVQDEVLIFVFSVFVMIGLHYLFNAKYPMYRGVSYLIILLYLAMSAADGIKKAWLLRLHMLIAFGIGIINLGINLRDDIGRNTEDVLSYAEKHGGYLTVSDNFNPNIYLYNKLYHHNDITITHFEAVDDDSLFLKYADSSAMILCSRSLIAGQDIQKKYNEIYSFKGKVFLRKK